jgi:hypothetical protein
MTTARPLLPIGDGLRDWQSTAYDRTRRMWWPNTADARHVQAAAGWLVAGYVIADVDYAQRRVLFNRSKTRASVH